MLHIRLPRELHARLRSVADQQRVSLQRIAEEALAASLRRPVLPDAAGVLAVYPDRRDPSLASRVSTLLGDSTTAYLAGINLLDFLAEDGWAYEALAGSLGHLHQARLVIPDREAPATKARLATTYGVAFEDDAAVRSRAKYLQLEYAEGLLESLKSKKGVSSRRTALTPSWRWLLLTDNAALAEPHLPRLRDGGQVSTQLMPVFEFQGGSAADERLREHFQMLWQCAR